MRNKFENKKIKKNPEEMFEKACEEVISQGYLVHKKNHDEDGEDPKIYHTSEHPKTLAQRASQISETLRLSNDQRKIIEMAIAWHDVVIEYEKADPDDLLSMVLRHRGARKGDMPKGADGNEGKSAQLLKQQMQEANKLAKKEIFTKEQIDTAVWTIEATYPDMSFGQNFEEYPYYQQSVAQNPNIDAIINELKTHGITGGALLYQPHMENALESGQIVPKEVITVALSDLGGFGTAEEEELFEEGDGEMLELYANLTEPDTLHRLLNGDDEQDKIDREKVATAFFKWLEGQPMFTVWQALRFEKIIYLLKQLNELTTEEEEKLRTQFSHFEKNVRATLERYEKLKKEFEKIKTTVGEKEAFVYLSKNLHYGFKHEE